MSKNQTDITIIHHFRIKEQEKHNLQDLSIFKDNILTS